jgi:hypothetical protein
MRYFLSRVVRLAAGQPHKTMIGQAAAFTSLRQRRFLATLRSGA